MDKCFKTTDHAGSQVYAQQMRYRIIWIEWELMKAFSFLQVVDMFGCGLPVCALSYSCITELVKDGKTGLLFSSAQGLAEHLAALLHGFGTQVCVS